jgi:hypothetical protein
MGGVKVLQNFSKRTISTANTAHHHPALPIQPPHLRRHTPMPSPIGGATKTVPSTVHCCLFWLFSSHNFRIANLTSFSLCAPHTHSLRTNPSSCRPSTIRRIHCFRLGEVGDKWVLSHQERLVWMGEGKRDERSGVRGDGSKWRFFVVSHLTLLHGGAIQLTINRSMRMCNRK